MDRMDGISDVMHNISATKELSASQKYIITSQLKRELDIAFFNLAFISYLSNEGEIDFVFEKRPIPIASEVVVQEA